MFFILQHAEYFLIQIIRGLLWVSMTLVTYSCTVFALQIKITHPLLFKVGKIALKWSYTQFIILFLPNMMNMI